MALKTLINELHRRSIWQVLAGYGVFVWLLFETFDVLRTAVGLPTWVEPTAAILVIVLLPALLATASVQTGRPARWPRIVFRDDEDAEDATSGAPSPPDSPPPGAAVEDAGGRGRREGASPPRSDASGRKRGGPGTILTWRNTLLGGVGAFVMLALVTAIYMILRTAGIGPAGTLVAQGTLDERERLILADFSSPDDLREVARAITEGLRVDLTLSPVVRIEQQRYVSAALARMELEPDAPLDMDLAREVAVREAIRGVVGGELRRVGSRFVITAQVVDATDGSVLVSRRATARDEAGILDAVDDLSKKLRERIGEPLASIGRADALERVTTSNLEALRKYSSAVRAIDVEGAPDRGIALLEEAVGLDSTFAMAWRKLGVALGNRGEERVRIVRALTAAYEHRDRLSSRERDLATAAYETNVTGDLQAAMSAYEALLDREPEHDVALNNLGDLHMRLRQFSPAAELFERALALDTADVIPFQNMVLTRTQLGEFDQAVALERDYPWLVHDPTVREHFAQVWAARGEYDEAERRLLALRNDEVASPFWQRQTSAELGALAATRGRLAEAGRHYADATTVAESRGLRRQALIYATHRARIELWSRRDPAAAIRVLEGALSAHPLEELEPLDRPSAELAEVFALAGSAARAQALVAAFEQEVPESLRGLEQRIALDRARGAVDLANGETARGIERTRASDLGSCLTCALPQLAEAYERAGEADSAIAVYERYLDTPYLWRVRDTDGWFLGQAHGRLGALYEAKGDTGRAGAQLARLARLWEGADDELQPRVAEARRRAAALLGGGR